MQLAITQNAGFEGHGGRERHGIAGLPAKRLVEDMARLGRLELPTYRFEVCRSIHLSYRRVF